MPRIMCTANLRRALGHTGRPAKVAEKVFHGVALGSWAAKAVTIDGRDLVLAVNERTYLTLVFPLEPDAFRENFAHALLEALEDCGVPPHVARAESAAIAFEPLASMARGALPKALATVEFFCGIELEYHTDLRTVQLNLNEFPHADIEHHVPRLAVKHLFASVDRAEPMPVN